MNNQKLTTLIGFAIKSGIVNKGIDNVKPNTEVCLIAKNASENTKNKLKKYPQVKVFEIDESILSNLLNEGVKVITIKKSELSKAIINLLEEK